MSRTGGRRTSSTTRSWRPRKRPGVDSFTFWPKAHERRIAADATGGGRRRRDERQSAMDDVIKDTDRGASGQRAKDTDRSNASRDKDTDRGGGTNGNGNGNLPFDIFQRASQLR